MTEGSQEKTVYFGFWTSVILKGFLSIAEVLAGAIILFIPTALLTGTAYSLIHSGLIGPESSFLPAQLLKVTQEFTRGAQTYVAFYLFARGVIKLAFITALLKNKLWAYPATLAVLGGLVAFQIYQIITLHSVIVVGITLFDLVVMYFIWSEYNIVKAHHGERKEHFETTGTE